MSGHWECEGNEFEDEYDMARYAIDNESYSDPEEFYDWVDSEYDASDIVRMLRDAQFCDSVYIDLEDEYNDWRVKNADEAKRGRDYEFGEFEFKWIEDEEERDRE